MRFQSNFIFIATKIDKNELNRKNTLSYFCTWLLCVFLCGSSFRREMFPSRFCLGTKGKDGERECLHRKNDGHVMRTVSLFVFFTAWFTVAESRCRRYSAYIW